LARGTAIDATCIRKCESKLNGAFARAERRSGCTTTGDAVAIATKIAAFVTETGAWLESGTTTTTSTTTTLFDLTSTTTTTIPCGLDDTICFGDCPPGLVCLVADPGVSACACLPEALECDGRKGMCGEGRCEFVDETCVSDEVGDCECFSP
jgi:hypothetical protein